MKKTLSLLLALLLLFGALSSLGESAPGYYRTGDGMEDFRFTAIDGEETSL